VNGRDKGFGEDKCHAISRANVHRLWLVSRMLIAIVFMRWTQLEQRVTTKRYRAGV
jgi:hypothetical protein